MGTHGNVPAPKGRGSTAASGRHRATATTNGEKSTRERILDAGEELFADRGFAGTAVRDIAAAVSLNAASLYNHFAGKDELYEAVLDRGLEPVMELLAGLTQVGDNRKATLDEQVIKSLVHHFAGRPKLARLIHHESLSGGSRLTKVAGRWLGPIYSQGLVAIRTTASSGKWEDSEFPLLIAAFHNIILGYFSMAPLLESVFDEDPLCEAAIERQIVFLNKVVARLIVEPQADTDSSSGA